MTRLLQSAVVALALLATQATWAHETRQEKINKQAAIAFYEALINQKDFEAASKYLGNRYVQHNPMAPDGVEAVKQITQMLKEKFPQQHNEIKHVFVDGDYVILHVHSLREPNTRGRAIVDIYKMENGKVVEHWDVIQDVPENPKNNNGMF
ncbi:MAG: ester cyclase [Steroidobacteraceae bacterium]